jgi:hypothetical protein
MKRCTWGTSYKSMGTSVPYTLKGTWFCFLNTFTQYMFSKQVGANHFNQKSISCVCQYSLTVARHATVVVAVPSTVHNPNSF